MSRSLCDDERKTIRVTVKISPNESKVLDEAGIKPRDRAKTMRTDILKKAKAIIKGKKK